jgi:transposase InsO family protein
MAEKSTPATIAYTCECGRKWVVPPEESKKAGKWNCRLWEDRAPRFLLVDRDCIFGADFTKQVKKFGIQEVLGAPRAPRQRAYIERVIGTIRRECLDHVMVCNETSRRRILTAYFSYYHVTRPHLSLAKDSPGPREVHPPELGRVIPQVGGLHHRYERRAA